MAFQALNVNHRMQRTATLSQQVLERAKKRKLYWYLPSHHQSRTFRGEAAVSLEAAFAAVAEHLACISAVCENYYCSVPPFQFEENEIEHIFRYHSREASKNLLRAFEDEEKKNAPTVEKQNIPVVEKQNIPVVEKPECHKTEPTALVPAQPSVSEEILIEVSPGSYIINTSSYDDTIKEAHLAKSGKSSIFEMLLYGTSKHPQLA
ncbi:A-kinase-interacting protein 1 [Vipera latastei]